MEEYCIIYGGTDKNPGPFIMAVSKDQNMINGCREQHYQYGRGGEIVRDNKYYDYAGDFEITCRNGHYMTPAMETEFMDYLTAIFNQLVQLCDVYETTIDEEFVINDYEREIMEDGFGLLSEHLSSAQYPLEIADIVEDSIYGETLNVLYCLDQFMSVYEPTGNIF